MDSWDNETRIVFCNAHQDHFKMGQGVMMDAWIEQYDVTCPECGAVGTIQEWLDDSFALVTFIDNAPDVRAEIAG